VRTAGTATTCGPVAVRTAVDIAENELPGQVNDEFDGATFSPDGHTLCVNIQAGRALTFAIWGPWPRLGL
jgi:secreted PhoX family phosphatase